MDSIPPIPEPQSVEPPHTMSLAGRLVNVFAAPGEVFDGIKAAPHRAANWLTPALLLILLSWISGWLIFSQPAIQQQVKDLSNRAIDRMVEKGRISSSQADQFRASAEKSGNLRYQIGGAVGSVFIAFASPFWGGLILWLVGSFVFKAPFPYMKAVEVAGLANMILVLDVVVRTLLVLITGNAFATLSLALVVTPKAFGVDPQNTFYSLLALMNVMTFWQLAIRSIGLARLTGASVGKAVGWVFGIWIVLSGILLGFGAAIRAAFGG